jgi:hypothetical protein
MPQPRHFWLRRSFQHWKHLVVETSARLFSVTQVATRKANFLHLTIDLSKNAFHRIGTSLAEQSQSQSSRNLGVRIAVQEPGRHNSFFLFTRSFQRQISLSSSLLFRLSTR